MTKYPFLGLFAMILVGCSSGSGTEVGTGGGPGSRGTSATGDAAATGGAVGTGGSATSAGAGGSDHPTGGSGGTAPGAGGGSGAAAGSGAAPGGAGAAGSPGSGRAGANGTGGSVTGTRGAAATGGAGGTAAYAPCPTDGSPCKILPFGDSITEGVKSSDDGGYRSQLFKLIVAAKQKVTFVGSLAQITPVGSTNSGHTQAEVDAASAAQMTYNSKIPAIIQSHAARGQHIVGVDMSKLPVPQDLTTASVHPNDQGYAYMASVWYPAIKDSLPK